MVFIVNLLAGTVLVLIAFLAVAFYLGFGPGGNREGKALAGDRRRSTVVLPTIGEPLLHLKDMSDEEIDEGGYSSAELYVAFQAETSRMAFTASSLHALTSPEG